MRRLWIRYILWLHGVCPKHGLMEGGGCAYRTFCIPCYATQRQERETYLDGLCKELTQ